MDVYLPTLKAVSVGSLIGDHLLLMDFGPVTVFVNVCVVITVAKVIMSRNFGPSWIIFTAYFSLPPSIKCCEILNCTMGKKKYSSK